MNESGEFDLQSAENRNWRLVVISYLLGLGCIWSSFGGRHGTSL
jgi:hypothetical protein